MTTLSVAQAEKDFAGTLRRVTTGHETVILQRGHKAVAVMVPPGLIEALEDAADIREADRVMKAIERGQTTLIPYEEVRKDLGLYPLCIRFNPSFGRTRKSRQAHKNARREKREHSQNH